MWTGPSRRRSIRTSAIGFLRFHNPDSSQAGSLTYDAVKELGLTGATTDPAGFPRMQGLSTGNFGGMSFNMGPTNANDYWNDKLNVVLDNYVHPRQPHLQVRRGGGAGNVVGPEHARRRRASTASATRRPATRRSRA